MAQVPTSPIRVFPQPVNLDTQALSGLSFEEGMGAFSTGAKLPLLMEQINHEKKRIKMENAKLDFAMSEAGRMQEQEARQLALDTKKAKLAALQQELMANTPLTADQIALLRGSIEAPAAPTVAPLADATLPPTVAPLKEPLSLVDGRVMVNQNPPGARKIVPVIAGSVVEGLPPAQGREALSPTLNAIENRLVDQVALQQASSGVLRPTIKQFNETRRALAKPSVETVTLRDPVTGVPFSQKVRTVAGQPTATIGGPQIDLDTLYKERPSQKAEDETFAKKLGDREPAAIANGINNLQQLIDAVDLVASSKDGLVESNLFIQLLPERARTLVTPNTMLAQEKVRTVIQQALRQTLGAQFARVEGEMMMNRAFNPLFEREVNLGQLASILRSATDAFGYQMAADEYFRDNNTLAGFKPPVNFGTDNPLTSYIESQIKKVEAKDTAVKATPETDFKAKVLKDYVGG